MEPTYLFGLDKDQMFVLLIVGIGCATAVSVIVVTVLSSFFYSAFRRRSEDGLKREMLDRGMTADEIETVVKATPPTDFLDRMADRKRRGR